MERINSVKRSPPKELKTEEEIKFVHLIIGASQEQTIASILKVAQSSSLVLITGPTGTGKSLVARAIHEESNRKNGPFVQVNCGAIPENLIESELYGHTKGAFTGADRNRQGEFAIAAGGTIFLDEIGEMPMQQQIRFLDVLDNLEFKPVGSETRVPVKARIIAATNKNLPELIRKEKFREDLFYRLNVLKIDLPPLSERKSDIPELIDFFIEKFKESYPLQAKIDREKIKRMKRRFPYMTWDGNIREMMHTIERILLQGEPEEEKQSEEISLQFIDDLPLNIPEMKQIVEKNNIQRALAKSGGNKTKAADMVGLSLAALLYKIKKYGLS